MSVGVGVSFGNFFKSTALSVLWRKVKCYGTEPYFCRYLLGMLVSHASSERQCGKKVVLIWHKQ